MTSQATRDIKSIIGSNLKAARKRKGLTQRELAAIVDVPDMHISRWERGAHRPNDAAMSALAKALGMTYSDFYATLEEAA